jgi:hypothetical protein
MAKLPTVERFKLSCEVEATNLGPTLAQFTKMGLTNLGFELITDVRRFNKNIKPDAPDVPEIGTTALLTAWIKDHPTFKAIEAVKHLEANGHTRGSAYPALRDFVEKGILKKLEPGHYSRADVKHLTGPKKTKPAKQTRRVIRPVRSFDKRGEDVILSYGKRNHGRFNTAKLVEVFLKEGRAKNSVYASIDALLKAKRAKRVGDNGSGQYVLLTKPAKTPKPKIHAPPRPNGSMIPAAPVEEAGVADHG